MVHNDWKKFIVEKLKYISLYFSCEIKNCSQNGPSLCLVLMRKDKPIPCIFHKQ